jgi:23S rRNA-/tRNA-specific pseudouridylate synthase
MHQIRCHLASQGWPILGDSLYKGDTSERLWLHAWKLSLPAGDGKTLELVAPLPEGWPVT